MPLAGPKDLFLCPPSHLDLVYEINPWMKKGTPFSRALAQEQWEGLVAAYRGAGAPGRIELCPPREGLPELCSLGDSVFLCDGKALFGRFRHAERAAETPYVRELVLARGFRGHELPPAVVFEGAGETMLWRDRILFGFGIRWTSARATSCARRSGTT